MDDKKAWFEQFINTDDNIIEIGPLNNPLFTKDKYTKIKYADIRCADDVADQYVAERMDINREALVDIDYVVEDSYPKAIGMECIDAFFSAHVIEHTADIIQHLIEIGECLKESGVYGIIVPNKEYAFDKYRAATTIRDAVDVHKHGNQALARLVFDSRINFKPQMAYIDKQSMHKGTYIPILSGAKGALARYDDFIIGVQHVWVFTYTTFLEFIRDAIMLEYIPFRLKAFCPHGEEKGLCDFRIVLEKDTRILNDNTERLIEVCRIQNIIDKHCGVPSLIDAAKGKNVYIYGAGEIGNNVFYYLKYSDMNLTDLKGFVVSDGHKKDSKLLGLPVYELSEVLTEKTDIFFVIAFADNSEAIKHLTSMNCDYFRVV